MRGRTDRPLTSWREVPAALRASHRDFFGAAGDAWCDVAPTLARRLADAWDLVPDGPTTHGAVAWVLPVRRADGTPAVLKVQPVDDETRGEPVALTVWDGDGAVRLLAHDPTSGGMLLERLGRSLQDEPDDLAGCAVIGSLLARLGTHAVPRTAGPAPAGPTATGSAAGGSAAGVTSDLARLDDVLVRLLDRVPAALDRLPDATGRDALARCAGVARDLVGEPAGDRLLHWDLHYANVLAATAPDRGDWLAIDPKPLVGDQGFELLPALRNRWDDVARAGVDAHVRRRFDALCDAAGLDLARAAAWTCVRVAQNLVWEGEQEARTWSAEAERLVAGVVLPLSG
ncbi:streptomycin 6-kinase [Isoptericola jiangsuensis]|uniref:Streptomycin 6-kinase n=1 Tax=Isoptericola jiangsuensis TaxID=548579 RepID=A0A2A9ES06_9MICO|nr:aminoglycoside phosphotransferase family protein [Isoptericola jiangsuensis]PFG41917.1 streptomycin 6-kinase [Isoptericola jiangsuensis]